jgi:hypothetical protein
MAILVRYDDPEFSKRYDLSVTDTTDPLLQEREPFEATREPRVRGVI